MPTLYLTEEYSLVRRETENMLLVEVPARETKDGVRGTPAYSKRIPLIKIDEVIVLGEITMTASALHLLLERDIEITFLGRYGQFKGRLSPRFPRMRSCGWRSTGYTRTWRNAVNWHGAS